MHEGPATREMLELVLAHAGGRRVRVIRLRLGPLAGMVPECVELYFEQMSKGTVAEGATLVFEPEAVEVTCRGCGERRGIDDASRTHVMEALAAGCTCGAADLSVTAGAAFYLTSIEV